MKLPTKYRMLEILLKNQMKYKIQIDEQRNNLLTDMGLETTKDRYLIKRDDGTQESPQEMFARVSCAYSNDESHAQRMYDYMSKMWFMPATPILANGGLKDSKSLPISCFVNEAQDTLEGILNIRNENGYLSTSGGGIGSYYGNIREKGSKIGNRGEALGVIPQIKVLDSMTLADTQSGIRRGSAAVYMQDAHPEIEEFIDIRRPTGDANRRSLNIHHGVCVSDAFMNAVQDGKMWDLISPASGKIVSSVLARDLWIKMLSSRVETGEPYILYTDTVNRNLPETYKAHGMKVKTSNLCSEITLLTGNDYLQKERTAVCCLSSLNLEYFESWKGNDLFIEDIMNFLDNVLEDFITRAPDAMARAKYAAMMERSVGLGVMGFHSFLQSKNTPIEGVAAKSWNKAIFSHIKTKADEASKKIATEKGACPDAKAAGLNERFANKIAIAPTASISIIAGNSSPGIEPYAANCYTHKTLSGSFIVRNKYLKRLLQLKASDNDKTWSSIALNEGSVQHLECLTPEEKAVFKTAMEINQMWLIDHAADRQKYICQAQSLNIFFPSTVEKKTLHDIHFAAWKKGVKSLYYCRSSSIQRAEKAPGQDVIATKPKVQHGQTVDMYDECLSCQ